MIEIEHPTPQGSIGSFGGSQDWSSNPFEPEDEFLKLSLRDTAPKPAATKVARAQSEYDRI